MVLASIIDWQQDWRKITGIPIKSPVSGQIVPISQYPQAFFQQDILTTAVACKLDHGLVLSPFAGVLSLQLSVQRRLIFRHQSGFSLLVELPAILAKLNGRGLNWLVTPQQTLTAGQPVLQLDLSYLQMALELEELWTVIALNSPVAIDKLYSRQAKLNAGSDPLFIMQLKKS